MSERNTTEATTLARRRLLQALAAAGAYVAIPSRWEMPSITGGILPAHAQTSGTVSLPDGGKIEVTPLEDGGTLTEICTVTLGSAGVFDGRPVYAAWFDVDAGLDADGGAVPDAGAPEGQCMLTPETAQQRRKLTVGYLAGSHGYSVNADFTYKIDAVSGAGDIPGDGASANCRENELVTFRCGERENRRRTWEFTIRVNGDLVALSPPATVTLFSAKLV